MDRVTVRNTDPTQGDPVLEGDIVLVEPDRGTDGRPTGVLTVTVMRQTDGPTDDMLRRDIFAAGSWSSVTREKFEEPTDGVDEVDTFDGGEVHHGVLPAAIEGLGEEGGIPPVDTARRHLERLSDMASDPRTLLPAGWVEESVGVLSFALELLADTMRRANMYEKQERDRRTSRPALAAALDVLHPPQAPTTREYQDARDAIALALGID